MTKCERCQAPPPYIKTGAFAGQSSMHDYCMYCSKNLCAKCMEEGRCKESVNGHHHSEYEDED